MSAKAMNTIKNRPKANDKIYTPPKVVDIILKFCGYKEGDLVLECCRGKGAIYNKLSDPKQYCEIDEGLDFFDYNNQNPISDLVYLISAYRFVGFSFAVFNIFTTHTTTRLTTI